MPENITTKSHTVFEAFELGKTYFNDGLPIDNDVVLYEKEDRRKSFRDGWRFQERQSKPPPPLKVEPSFSNKSDC